MSEDDSIKQEILAPPTGRGMPVRGQMLTRVHKQGQSATIVSHLTAAGRSLSRGVPVESYIKVPFSH